MANYFTYSDDSDSWKQIDANRHKNFETRSISLPIMSF